MARGPTPPSAEDFGREPAIRDVGLSPDGKHIVALVSPDGAKAYISIWNTADMSQAPTVLGCGERSQCVGVGFIKNAYLFVQVRQEYNAGKDRGHLFRFFTTDLQGKVWRNADGTTDQNAGPRASVVDNLPDEPNVVMIYIAGRKVPGEDFVPDRNYYKLNLITGRTWKVFTGSDKFFGVQTDLKGEIRARQSFDYENGNAYIAQWIRDPKTNQWVEHFRWFAKDRIPQEVVGFTEDPNIVYVRTSIGQDHTAIYEYDVTARKLLEPVFQIKSFDAENVIQSTAAGGHGRLLGFTYSADTTRSFWLDPKLAELTRGVRQALGIKMTPVDWTDIASGEKVKFSTPDGADARLIDWSDDLKYAVVIKVGARQPAEYYLLTDSGKLSLLGKTRPTFDTSTLGDMRLVQYAARDGLMIPALLTTPRKEIYGSGPFPTLIVPHGGPWARDNLGWDPTGWVQYFASRGYAVLQPQYRGSEGFGQKLWRAGDREWGQKMQDDNDDGAKWLISAGIADPGRIAMHGYSYGGYAAMAAGVRPNGLYQCAIAGAGPASMTYMQTRTSWDDYEEEYQGVTVAGLSPIDHADEVSIPMFIYHGDRDTNVPVEQSRRFVAALKAAGKPVKYMEVKDMGHSINTWGVGNLAQVLTAVDDFLRTDCGPGGL